MLALYTDFLIIKVKVNIGNKHVYDWNIKQIKIKTRYFVTVKLSNLHGKHHKIRIQW